MHACFTRRIIQHGSGLAGDEAIIPLIMCSGDTHVTQSLSWRRGYGVAGTYTGGYGREGTGMCTYFNQILDPCLLFGLVYPGINGGNVDSFVWGYNVNLIGCTWDVVKLKWTA
jgi:hypothetical protein